MVYACLQEWKGIKKKRRKNRFFEMWKKIQWTASVLSLIIETISLHLIYSHWIFFSATLFLTFFFLLLWYLLFYIRCFRIEYFTIFHLTYFRWFYEYVYLFLLAFANARTQLFVSDTIENCNKTSLDSNWYYAKRFGLSTLEQQIETNHLIYYLPLYVSKYFSFQKKKLNFMSRRIKLIKIILA